VQPDEPGLEVFDLLCLAVLLLIIALIAWGVMNFFQKEKLEMVQENQGTFEVVMVNDEEE